MTASSAAERGGGKRRLVGDFLPGTLGFVTRLVGSRVGSHILRWQCGTFLSGPFRAWDPFSFYPGRCPGLACFRALGPRGLLCGSGGRSAAATLLRWERFEDDFEDPLADNVFCGTMSRHCAR